MYTALTNLHRDQRGTISIVSVFAMLLLTMLLGMVMNVGRQVDGKIRMQNATDSAAYSGGVVLARGMNTLAFTNHMLCDVFAVTAVMREARDRNSASYVPGILAAWQKVGGVFAGSQFPKFSALGAAILQEVPLEQALVDRYSDWATAASQQILPLMEEILSNQLIPQYQRAVVAAFPDIAQSAAIAVAQQSSQPDYGRGLMMAAMWRTSGKLVGGDNGDAASRTLPVIDPEMDALPDQAQYQALARQQRSALAHKYLNDWNNQTMIGFDQFGKMCQFDRLVAEFHLRIPGTLAQRGIPQQQLVAGHPLAGRRVAGHERLSGAVLHLHGRGILEAGAGTDAKNFRQPDPQRCCYLRRSPSVHSPAAAGMAADQLVWWRRTIADAAGRRAGAVRRFARGGPAELWWRRRRRPVDRGPRGRAHRLGPPHPALDLPVVPGHTAGPGDDLADRAHAAGLQRHKLYPAQPERT